MYDVSKSNKEGEMSILRLFKKSQRSLKPTIKKSRHKCLFYGFYSAMSMKIFSDSGGNQCALAEGYSPCQMEMKEETPDWDKCPFNNEEAKHAIEKIMTSHKIFPEEFKPEGKSTWTGMPLKEWMDYVMGDTVERPQ